MSAPVTNKAKSRNKLLNQIIRLLVIVYTHNTHSSRCCSGCRLWEDGHLHSSNQATDQRWRTDGLVVLGDDGFSRSHRSCQHSMRPRLTYGFAFLNKKTTTANENYQTCACSWNEHVKAMCSSSISFTQSNDKEAESSTVIMSIRPLIELLSRLLLLKLIVGCLSTAQYTRHDKIRDDAERQELAQYSWIVIYYGWSGLTSNR